MMQLTAELRWFNRGRLPKEISHWFQQECLGDYLAAPEEREDIYLYVPECDYLGIKLRQGRLEIKWRQAELGVVSFGNHVEGKAEKWSKWLCEDSMAETFQPKSAIGQSWVRVKKARLQRQYQVLPDNSATAVPVTDSINQGCTVELTDLVVNGNAWWSLAFEAFGEDERLTDHLQNIASRVIESNCGLKLQGEDSYGYPTWLYKAISL